MSSRTAGSIDPRDGPDHVWLTENRRPDGVDDDTVEDAGHSDIADQVRTELVGRNVLEGRWTFQIVEEYDATYWVTARSIHHDVEEQLVGGMPHVYESEMKERRRTAGHPRHTARPDPGA